METIMKPKRTSKGNYETFLTESDKYPQLSAAKREGMEKDWSF